MEGGTTTEVVLQDPVTGLGNRRALLAALREQVPVSQGAVILLDIDGFRSACEKLGKPLEDQLLVAVAERIRSTADPLSLLYRYAGDSFFLLIPEADRDRAAAAAEALRAAVAREPFEISGKRVELTACTSAAAFPIDGRTPASLIESAERALFVAKHLGRNRSTVSGRLDPVALAEIGIFRGLPCPVQVGHSAEQSRLRQLAGDVRESGPAQALLSGVPGMGKTRLVRELCAWARGQHFIVLSGTCQEERTTYPYATLADQIETLIQSDPPSILPVLEKLEPVQRSALAVVLRQMPTHGPLPEIDLSDYGRLIFESFSAVVDGLARSAPLIVVADEAEFGDDASFEVYREALKRKTPFFLVATTDRLAEFEKSSGGDFFREMGPTVHRMEILPLPPEDVRQMLKSIFPDAGIAPETVERLVAASQGNPLYVEEAIRALLLRGRIKLIDGRWTIPNVTDADIPASLDDAIRAVVAALPKRANSLLTRAAVIGSRVDPDLLQEVLGQDETEMLDLLDEVRRSRLLLMSDNGEDLLSFPAAHARRIRLVSADATEKREIHGRLGVVQESRHGGDVAHVADELAYHYGQAGDHARARHFGEIARKQANLIRPPIVAGSRRTRIPVMTDPLPAEALEHALSLLRNFTGVLKVGRLYPQWSQVGAGFLAQLRSSMEAVMSHSEGITISVVPEGTAINGMVVKSGVVDEFAALMDARLIESITILSGFDPEKIDTILRAFVEPMDRIRAAPDLWDRFLTREGIEALDIVQKAYQAKDTDRRGTAVHGDQPVPADHVPAVRDIIRSLKAAVDGLKLYPPGHPIVEKTAGEAVQVFLDLLGKIPAVTFATAEGELVVNGMPTDKKFFGDAGEFLAKEIDLRDLKSISIWSGLAGDEVLGIISFLSMSATGADPSGDADKLLAGLAHVSIGSRHYERAHEGETGEPVELHPPPKPIRSEIRAREHLAKPYARFLTTELEQQFPVLVESLAYGNCRPLAVQLVDRLGTHFHDAELSHRSQAYQVITRAMAFASPTTRRLEVLHSTDALKARLTQDVVPQFFRAAANVLPVWIPAAATVGCLKELAEVVGGTLRRRADGASTPPEIAAVCESALQLIPQSRAYSQILAAVERPDTEDRKSSIRILLAVGGTAIEKLAEMLADEVDDVARRNLAEALAPHAEAVSGELARVFQPSSPPDRIHRVLKVLEPLISPALAGPLAALLETGSEEIRRDVLHLADRWPKPLALSIARRLVGSADPATRDSGIELAGRLRIDALGAEIGRILETAEEEKLMTLCCRYFAAAPNPASVPILVRITQARPKFFGMVKGYSAATRAAAVRALLEQKTKQADEAVAAAVKEQAVRQIMNQT